MTKFLSAPVLGMLATAMAALCQPVTTANADSIDLTIASGYPPVIDALKVMESDFFPTVEAKLEGTGHTINWNKAFAGTLAKAPDVFEAVESGLTDVGHIVFVFEGAQLPLQNVGYYAAFGTDDTKLASDAFNQLQSELPEMAAEWTNHNQVYLGNYPLDTYELWAKKPIKSIDDIKGLKVGGGGANLPWIRGTGAAGVSTTGATAYNDLKTGVIDAVLAPATLGNAAKFYEVAPYLNRVSFGAVSVGAITVNKDVWDKLPVEVQDALKAGAQKWREAMIVQSKDSVEAATESMKGKGLNVIDVSPEERLRWATTIPNPAAEWLSDATRKKTMQLYMDHLKEAGADFPRNWAAEE